MNDIVFAMAIVGTFLVLVFLVGLLTCAIEDIIDERKRQSRPDWKDLP